MWYFILFAITGGWLAGQAGFIAGLIVWGIFYFVRIKAQEAFSTIERLTASVADLQLQLYTIQKRLQAAWPEEEAAAPPPAPAEEAETLPPLSAAAEQAVVAPRFAAAAAAAPPVEAVEQEEADTFLVKLFRQLHRVGTVVQTGIVVLLFGLVFLVRYAAKTQQFTVETGLIATMAVGIVLLAIGWRLAASKRAYALMLQGGSVAVLFTCLFLSTEMYSLFPVFVSFAAMICLSALAGLLAVRHNARETALIGMGGGFAAPLLSPVTSDQLIVLFAYYLMLAAGIFMVSRLRNWRALQLLSCLLIIFVGIFIGEAEDIVHVRWQLEPLLLLFFLFYTMTEFLSARSREDAWGDGMDIALAFAPPLACAAFQTALSHPNAASLLTVTLAGLTCYYAAAAWWLQRADAAGRLVLLRRICIVLAFCCGNLLLLRTAGILASTLLFNAEAVCCIWLAARRRQELPLWLGMTLLLLTVLMAPLNGWPLLLRSQPLLAVSAALSFCLSPFLCAVLLERLSSLNKSLAKSLLLWSLGLWLLGGMAAVTQAAPADWATGAALLFASLSFVLLHFGSQRLGWAFMNQLGDSFGIILSMIAIAHLKHAASLESASAVFVGSSSLGWLISLSAYYALLFLREPQIAPPSRRWQHRLGIWLAGGIGIMQLCGAANAAGLPQGAWMSSLFGGITGGWIIALLAGWRKLRWPLRQHQADCLGHGILPFAAAAWLWTLNACLSLGDPSPLKYVPLLNPVETAQGICLTALFLWANAVRQPTLQAVPLPAVIKKNMAVALHGTLFLCVTMMIARSVCYYTHITFSADGLLFSPFLQTIISVIWSGAAFAIMLLAGRANRQRESSLGTLLLFLVAAKLFLVDIHLSTELERICSFIWVGGIMLLAGYHMPTEDAA